MQADSPTQTTSAPVVLPASSVAVLEPPAPATAPPLLTNNAGFKNPHSLHNRMGRLLWRWVWMLLVRPSPFFMTRWRKFLLRSFGAKIGTGRIKGSAIIWAPWLLRMGDDTFIDEHVRLYNPFGLEIGNRVTISQHAFLCTASHDYTDPQYRLTGATIRVEDDVWIAADAFISPGITIGQGAVVGARAVVTRDVPPWTVVAGNPARVIKQRVLKEGGTLGAPGGKEAAQ